MDARDDQVHLSLKPKAKIRQRARKACLSCRARKVRCDVSQRGRPCMNCHLDNESCIVTGRASKFRRALADPRDGIQASYPPYPPIELQPDNRYDADLACDLTSEDQQNSCANDVIGSSSQTLHLDRDNHPQHQTSTEGVTRGDEPRKPWNQHPQAAEMCAGSTDECGGFTQPDHVPLLNYLANNISTPPSNDNPPRPSSDVVYCFYPFLAVANIHNIRHEDVNFLELQGCLRVPTRALLDDLVQQYFLHVHPVLPLINEGDFWDLYYHDNRDPPAGGFSLLLLQAMLFASCNFVSVPTMKRLGFDTIRMMRSTFYRRAKLLYDMESENSHLPMAQAALLLSFASLSSAKKPNTTWLSLAIENAKSVEAHICTTMPSSSLSPHQAILKRVWWCCIIRDRSVGLLMRRPIHITRHHFDFNTNYLGFTDFINEFEKSKVYDPDTKRSLAEILAQSIQLYIVLTDVLMLCFRLDGKQGWSADTRPDDSTRLQECRLALKKWYKHAAERLTTIGGDTNRNAVSGALPNVSHESVVLYTNFILMYYHTSRAILCHHEVLHLSILKSRSKAINNSADRDLSVILENQSELQDAASSITKCHEQLVSQRLARWLPVSAIGCTALPLVLNILDVKLALPNGSSNRSNNTPVFKQQELNILIEVMRAYQPQYDGVDWVSEIIRHITNLVQLDNSNHAGHESKIDWAQIFAFQPNSYLRLALTLDFGLSTGRLPHEDDFPVGLKESVAIGFCPPHRMSEATGPGYMDNYDLIDTTFWQELNLRPSSLMDSEVTYDILSTGRAFDDIFGNQTCLDSVVECAMGSHRGSLEDVPQYVEILSSDGDSHRGTSELEDQCNDDSVGDSKPDHPRKERSEMNKDHEVDPDPRMMIAEAIGDGNIGECIG